jgi:hypothetical protein
MVGGCFVGFGSLLEGDAATADSSANVAGVGFLLAIVGVLSTIVGLIVKAIANAIGIGDFRQWADVKERGGESARGAASSHQSNIRLLP